MKASELSELVGKAFKAAFTKRSLKREKKKKKQQPQRSPPGGHSVVRANFKQKALPSQSLDYMRILGNNTGKVREQGCSWVM